MLKSSIERAVMPSPSRPKINWKVIIYTPTQRWAKDFAFKLGKYLDTTQNLHEVDIFTLVGTMMREEKVFYTNTFLDENAKV